MPDASQQSLSSSAALPVTLALSFDDRFCTYAAAALHSIIAHADPRRRYRICIVEEASSPLATLHREWLAGLADGQPSVSIEFVPADVRQLAGCELYKSSWWGGALWLRQTLSAPPAARCRTGAVPGWRHHRHGRHRRFV